MSSQSKSQYEETGPLGAWLRQVRTDRGLPIRKVAAAADMDMAQLSKVELGKRFLTNDQAASIAKFLGMDARKVVGRLLAERIIQELQKAPEAAQEAISILKDEGPAYSGSRKR